MKKSRLIPILVSVAFLLAAGCGTKTEPEKKTKTEPAEKTRTEPRPKRRPHPREKLDTTIAQAIRVLEAKKYATFIKYFATPAALQEMMQTASLEEIVEEFVDEKADQVLSTLKSLKHKQPRFSADGKKATYPINIRGSTIKTVTFVKVGKYWYIQN